MTAGTSRRARDIHNRKLRRAAQSEPYRVAELLERVAELENTIETLAETGAHIHTAVLESAEKLDKQMARVGREQFKVNAVIEAQQATTRTSLEQLQEASANHEREVTQLRLQLAAATEAGQMSVIRAVLPTLDGLEMALESAQRQRDAALARMNRSPSFWERLSRNNGSGKSEQEASLEAMSASLEGLTFIHERLLSALTVADVTPIKTLGQPFDPHLHVAVETVPQSKETRAGQVVREHRRGYMHGDTVVRYAEVVVVSATTEAAR